MESYPQIGRFTGCGLILRVMHRCAEYKRD
jgi:hypothetical protein